MNRAQRYHNMGYVYLIPWIVGFLVFQLFPLGYSLVLSFYKYPLLGEPTFVGVRNYVKMFTTDPNFMQSVRVTFLYVVLVVPTKIIFALMVALLSNMSVRGVGLFRMLFYLPSIFGSSVAISILWRSMFLKRGLVNSLLSLLGVPAFPWLTSTSLALPVVASLQVWQFGSSMVIFLAGLKQIPTDYYDSARIDGANPWQMLLRVTLPLLTPMIFFNVVMQTILAFQDFTAPFIVTNRGGPLHATYVLGIHIYNHAFTYFNMGYGSGLSWMLFLVIMFFTALIFRSSRRWVHYES